METFIHGNSFQNHPKFYLGHDLVLKSLFFSVSIVNFYLNLQKIPAVCSLINNKESFIGTTWNFNLHHTLTFTLQSYNIFIGKLLWGLHKCALPTKSFSVSQKRWSLHEIIYVSIAVHIFRNCLFLIGNVQKEREY